jgi:hypothetical protein
VKRYSDKRQAIKDVLSGKKTLKDAFPAYRPLPDELFTDEETDYMLFVILNRNRQSYEQRVMDEVVCKINHQRDQDLWEVLENADRERALHPRHEEMLEETLPQVARFTPEVSERMARQMLEKVAARRPFLEAGVNHLIDEDDLKL